MALQDIKEEEPEIAFGARQCAQRDEALESAPLHVVGLGMIGVPGVSGVQTALSGDPGASTAIRGGNVEDAAAAASGEMAGGQEALLPPLPDVNGVSEELIGGNAAVVDATPNAAAPAAALGDSVTAHVSANTTSVSLESSTGTADSVLSSAMERVSEPDTSFDLSKALEIPHDSSNSNSNPMSPVLTSPKLSLKRKFSSSLMPAATNIAAPVAPANGNSCSGDASSAAVGTGANNAASIASHSDLPLRRSSTRSSSHSVDHNSKTNSPINILPRLSANLESAAAMVKEQMGLDNSNSNSNSNNTVRKLPRKFSFGSSSSSSHSFHDNDDLVYKPPPTLLEGDREFPTSGASSPASPSFSSSMEFEPGSARRMPLLKRASSAILRKTSLSKKDPEGSGALLPSPALMASSANELRQTSSFSALSYESELLTKQRGKNKRKLFIRTALSSTRSCSSPETLDFSTPISAITPSLSSERLSSQRSLRSKFKRSFTRIISGSPSEKNFLPESVADDISVKGQAPPGVSTTPSSEISGSPLLSSLEDSTPFEPPGITSRVTPVSDNFSLARRSASFTRPTVTKTSSSTSTVRQTPVGKRNPGSKKTSNYNKKNASTTGSLNTGRDNSVFSGNDTSGSVSNESEIEEITVDIDEITKALPVITITEKFGAKNATPIQTQSNIGLDKVYQEDSRRAVIPQSIPDELKPSKISLREYIDILIQQQRVEDERFAVLEKNFSSSGWCSQDDIISIKQKRIVINKKWAERISYYQNRLEV